MCLRFDWRVESPVVVVVEEEGRNRRQFQQWGLNTETRPKRQSESLGGGVFRFCPFRVTCDQEYRLTIVYQLSEIWVLGLWRCKRSRAHCAEQSGGNNIQHICTYVAGQAISGCCVRPSTCTALRAISGYIHPSRDAVASQGCTINMHNAQRDHLKFAMRASNSAM